MCSRPQGQRHSGRDKDRGEMGGAIGLCGDRCSRYSGGEAHW